MMSGDNRQKLFDHMTALMANDRAKHNILPLSKFCLMQITRQRVRPAMAIQTDEVCPTCMGTGKARPAILLVEELEDQLKNIARDLNIKKLKLSVHPYLAAYLKKGLWSLERRWRWKYKCNLQVQGLHELGFLEFRFTDKHGDEVDLKLLSDTK